MEHKTKPGWKPWKPPPEKRDRWERWGLREKTGWDWLNLLVVPAMLVLVAGVFTTVQVIYQSAAESQRQQAIADQTAQVQRIIEESRGQEASLQAYLDLMATLLLEHNLRESEVGSEVRAIAQAQTFTTLRKMDGRRKGTIVLFLSDAGLLQRWGPVIRLADADLSGADMRRGNLSDADLSGADLSSADLSSADLSDADLSGAELIDANLSFASISGANVSGAYLRRANLSETDCIDADLSGADLSGAKLSGAFLRDANLGKTYLIETDLSDTDLSGAIIRGANLHGANLHGANLHGARGVTDKQLLQAKTLEGATMPDGSIHH